MEEKAEAIYASAALKSAALYDGTAQVPKPLYLSDPAMYVHLVFQCKNMHRTKWNEFACRKPREKVRNIRE